MKKVLILLILTLFVTSIVYAVPAIPVPVVMEQPDGDSLTVRIKGDERISWYESMDGYTLLFNTDKYLTYAYLDENGNLQPSDFIATDVEKRSESVISFLNTIEKRLNYSNSQKQMLQKIGTIEDEAILKKKQRDKRDVTGNYKTLCAFVQFPEKSMTKTMNDFSNLLNQKGYTGNGTGSVRDFFNQASYNKFDLTITLCGIYTTPNSEEYYLGDNGKNGRCNELGRWIAEQIAAEPSINFADYDSDGDDMVDGFHFIFAGRGQEAGGGAGTIWSHKWGFLPEVTKNGKYVYIYSCSPELLYSNITTIGVICHEMAHAFGAMDYYDTDYDEGGEYAGTGMWDLMAGGSWNGYPGGNCPPHPNPHVKIQYGWVDPIVLNEPTTITKMPNSAENSLVYRINTTTNNEYFLLENRQPVKFDADVPGSGLLIYRVHANIESSFYDNKINATHPQMMYPVCASSNYSIPTAPSYTYGDINSGGCTFPGYWDNYSFTDSYIPSMRSWAGNNTNKPITNIKNTNKLVGFDFMGGGCPVVSSFTVDYNNNCEAVLKWATPYAKSLKNLSQQEDEFIEEEAVCNDEILKGFNSQPQKASDYRENISLFRSESYSDSKDGWIKWCGTNYDHIGAKEGLNTFIVAARFTPQDLAAAGVKTGDVINQMKIHINETWYCNFYVQIYSGGTSPTNPGNLDLEEGIYGSFGDGYVDLVLDNTYTINASKELWIGYKIVPSYSYSNLFPAGCDAGPRVANKGDIINWGGSWGTLYDLSSGSLNGNWNIEALVETSFSGTANYNVYRDGTLLASNISATSYTDKGFNTNQGHTWSVRVLCEGGGESPLASVSKEGCKVGIKENVNNTISVTPNPTTGEFKVSGLKFNDRLLSEVEVEIYDMTGRPVGAYCIRPNIPPSGGTEGGCIDISHLPAGIYFLRIDGQTVKIVKK